MPKIPYSVERRPSCGGGVSDSVYPHMISPTQVNKAVNFDMTGDGFLESRGGTIRVSDTTVGATSEVTLIHEYVKRNTDGTLTRTFMLKAGTVLYKYNATTGVFDSVKDSLSSNKPSMVNFISTAGADVTLYADGENFGMYDGTTWTDISTAFKAGAATDFPRYLWVKHSVCWAAGDDSNPDKIMYCDPLKPDSNWGANSYITIEGGLDKITGINEVYSYVVVGTQKSLYIITGKVAADFAPLKVNKDFGVSSHWGIVSESSHVYFANNNGFYVGKLRVAEVGGMDVEYVGGNMASTFSTIVSGSWDTIEGVYFDPMKQIYWAIRTGSESYPDKLFVYSTARSNPEAVMPEYGPDTRFVWAGYHTGLDYCCLGVVADSNGLESLYVGGSDGFTRQLYSGYKDDRAVGASTGTDISYEIRTREEVFGSISQTVRVVNFLPTLFQKINGSTTIQYIIDRSTIGPDTAKSIYFRGNIPYWHDGVEDITSKWGSTIWDDKPILTAKVKVGKLAHSFIAVITNDGSSTKAAMTWVGYDIAFQRLRRVRARNA